MNKNINSLVFMTSQQGPIPAEVVSLIYGNPVAAKIMAEVLKNRKVLYDYSPKIEHQAVADLVGLGLAQTHREGTTVYASPTKVSYFLELSNAVIFSQASGQVAQTLDEAINKRVKLGDIDGVLIAEKGSLYHISRCFDYPVRLDGKQSRPLK